jgi:hypothetical protein
MEFQEKEKISFVRAKTSKEMLYVREYAIPIPLMLTFFDLQDDINCRLVSRSWSRLKEYPFLYQVYATDEHAAHKLFQASYVQHVTHLHDVTSEFFHFKKRNKLKR